MSFADNKKAYHDYHILSEYEAGILLSGQEVKSLRNKRGSLQGAYVKIYGGEPWLLNMHIPPYQEKNAPPQYAPDQPRKLLLHKKELDELRGQSDQKGLTIIPLSLYSKGRYIKAKIGIGRGKKKADKRETIKKRDVERKIRRTLQH